MTTNQYVARQLARQAGKTIATQQEAWNQAGGRPDCAALDRMHALEAEVQWHPAGNGEGALLQLGVLGGLFEMLPVDWRNCEEIGRAKDRLVAHLKVHIETTAGVSARAMGLAPYYFSDPDDDTPPSGGAAAAMAA